MSSSRQSQASPGSPAGRGRGWLAFATSLVLTAGALSPAFATLVRRMSLPEIVAASERIVEGRVESVRSYWEGKQIWTEVTVGVARSHKGNAGGSATFVQLGGRVERPVPVQMSVAGTPEHRVGDQAFFFLEPERGGRRLVVGIFRGHAPILSGERGPFVVFDGSSREPAEFVEAIRRAVAGQAHDAAGGGEDR